MKDITQSKILSMKLFSDNFSHEIDIRIKKLREIMTDLKLQSLLVAANVNVYYLSGRFFRGYVYVSIDEPPLWFLVKPDIFESQNHIVSIRKPEQIPDILSEKGYTIPESLGLEFDDLSYSQIIRLKNIFPNSQLHNGSEILKRSRMIKTDWEITQMRIDGRHHANVYSKVKDCYKPGMTDLQFQIEIEKVLRLEGALGISRVSGNLMEINLGSVISGENADNPGPYEFTMGGAGVDSSLPVGADNSLIRDGKTIMVDMSGAFNGYQTDMTRVWCKPPLHPLAKKAHDCSIKILHFLEGYALPGKKVANLYEKAMEIVKESELTQYFMGHKSQVSFIGHGIGIELNELPVVNSRSKEILQENMTIALEPKFVLPGIGAVGIENTYRVTHQGLENLTIFPEFIQPL